MTAAEVPASIICTSVNTKEHKVFQTLSNNSVLELEHSLLKNINLKTTNVCQIYIHRL